MPRATIEGTPGKRGRLKSVWDSICTLVLVLSLVVRFAGRVFVVLATPVIAVLVALWAAQSFSVWLAAFTKTQDLSTYGLASGGVALLLKQLRAVLIYAKESWQYILGKAALDFRGYAIEILVFCLGCALAVNALPGVRESPTLETTRVEAPRVVSRAIFLPTFKFESAALVATDGIALIPGVEVDRDSVEPTKEQRGKIEEFADKLIRCANAEGSRDPIEVEVLGFASDAAFRDPGVTRVRDDSDKLNVLVANHRARSMQRELHRALTQHPEVGPRSIVVKPRPWSTDDGGAGFKQMQDERMSMSHHLETFFNASMDYRAAIVMNAGRVCRARFYRPDFEMVPDAP